jgi:hypothetical protein
MNESLPIPTPVVVTDVGNSAISNPNTLQVTDKSIYMNGSIKYKFERISDVENVILTTDHYFIEIDTNTTKKIMLPNITTHPAVFYIIRKHYSGLVVITPDGVDTIEGDSTITIYSDDQILKLTNDSLNTWLLL